MTFKVTLDYDLPDTKKWILYNGERYEGDIVWYDGSTPELEKGYHLEMMDVGDESNDFNDRLTHAGVFGTFHDALLAAEAYR